MLFRGHETNIITIDALNPVGHLALGIPKSNFWATAPNGINQIGCVYTAQGFEFDYVGVIFGNDLVYDFEQQEWKGNRKCSEDKAVKSSKDKFTDSINLIQQNAVMKTWNLCSKLLHNSYV